MRIIARTQLFIISLLILSQGNISAQRKQTRNYPINPRAYGLTYDGNDFWYTDPSSRRLYNISSRGRERSFFIGNVNLYGVGYNKRTGFLYLGSKRRIFQINPITGRIEQRISVPVSRVAGIAFGEENWLLLEKGTGIVHIYNPELGKTIDRLNTPHKSLRDIAVHLGNLWLTDGKTGVIYRYSIRKKTLTGTLKGPHDKLRGLCFREGQLWVVNRRKRRIERLAYSETERYILSGERKFRVRITLNFTIPLERKTGIILVLQPPPTASQRPRNIRSTSPGWKNAHYSASGQKLFSLNIAGQTPGPKEFSYEYNLTTQNIRYYIPETYKAEKEEFEFSPAFFYTRASARAYSKQKPYESLVELMGAAQKKSITANSAANHLQKTFQKKKLPVRWSALYKYLDNPGKKTNPPYIQAETYLRNFGWTPLSWPPEDKLGFRIYSRDLNTLELYRMPDMKAEGVGPIFITNAKKVSGVRKMKALKATIKVEVLSRRN